MQSYILLDQSGSMGSRWTEALSSINSYVDGLRELQGDYNVSVISFDTNSQWQNPVTPTLSQPFTTQTVQVVNASTFTVLRNKESVKSFKPLTNLDCMPRGGTPLYDATNKLINLVEIDNYDKAVVVIMTDGEENSSKEIRDPNIIKKRLDTLREKGYQIIFLGADFENAQQSYSLGGGYGNTISVASANLAGTMRNMASKSALYASAGTSMTYSAEEKAAALDDIKSK